MPLERIMSNLAYLLLLIGAVFVQAISCSEFSQTPEWANIKLKHVERGPGASQEGKWGSIGDYAEGAILMHDKLFSQDLQVRCSAYGHLFKLIDVYGIKGTGSGAKHVTLETVAALDMVADADRDEYNKLFATYRAGSLKEIFLAAIKGLEMMPHQTDASNATWLELVDCAFRYNSSIKLDKFLSSPKRVMRIEQLKRSSSDANTNGPDEKSVTATSGQSVVSSSNRGRLFDYLDLVAARAKVEQFDDDELRQLRSQLVREKLNDQRIEMNIAFMNYVKDWLVVLDWPVRIEAKRLEKMHISVVANWIKDWEELLKVRESLKPDTAIAALVEDYISSKRNQILAKRMKTIMSNYSRMKKIIKEGVTSNLYTRLRQVYKYPMEVLNELNELIDDADIRQVVEKLIGEDDFINAYTKRNRF